MMPGEKHPCDASGMSDVRERVGFQQYQISHLPRRNATVNLTDTRKFCRVERSTCLLYTSDAADE